MDEDGQEVTCASWQVWGVQHRTVGALGRAVDNAEWTQQGVQCLETGLRLLCRVRNSWAGLRHAQPFAWPMGQACDGQWTCPAASPGMHSTVSVCRPTRCRP